MGASLRDQLAVALPEHRHKLLFYKNGRKHPAYNLLSVDETLKEYCSVLLPLSPLVDPRGKRISIVKGNFPKLAGLEPINNQDQRATEIINAIENGTFNLGGYDPTRDDRLRTLFWIPETICEPDAIYRNAHKIVVGNEVYVSVYDKMGSTVKLIFTLDIRKNGKVIRTVPVTSFLSTRFSW
jgi:hypothetical protein